MPKPISNKNLNTAGIRLILGYVCVFIAFAGGMVLLPLVILLFFRDEWACFPAFVIPGGSALLFGAIMGAVLMKGQQKGKLGKFQDSVLLVLIWLVTILIGAFPFFLADKVDFFSANNNAISMSFSESFFESASGFTATGFTLLHGFLGDGTPAYSSFYDAEISYCSHVFLFYRAVTQFFGGVGLVLVVASAVSDRFGMQLFNTEGHNDRLLPNLAKTAKATFGIYTIIIILGTLSMWLFGMDLFESLCHSISGMATGGFSTRISGFWNYTNPKPILGVVNQVGIEVTMEVIMILGAISFLLLYNALTWKWKNFIRDCELRFMAFAIAICTLMGFFLLHYQYYDGVAQGLKWTDALRYSSFQIISCITTTGFSNAPSIVALGQGVILLSIILMFIGGGVGSTAGAIKQLRIIVIFKSLWWSVLHKFSPSRMRYPHVIVRAGKDVEIDNDRFKDDALYAFLYILVVIFFATFLIFLPNGLTHHGYTITESVYTIVSSLSGTGNSVIDFFAIRVASDASGVMWSYNMMLWIVSLCMFLGRLEILPVYYALRRFNRVIARRQIV